MPYIPKKDRGWISSPEHGYINVVATESAGELQYAMAIMIKDYMNRKGLNYQHCNDVMGALAGAQMEFYRRTVAPYEDKKLKENGDV